MANACGLFGDLIPNVYIDRVTLEESQIGTQQDKDGNFIGKISNPIPLSFNSDGIMSLNI